MSNALVNGLAGAGGGIIAQIITYPLQTVNTRQQTERVARKGVLQSLEATSSTAEPPKPSSGLLLQIIQLIKTEGWGGLYSGLKPSLLGTAASQAADQDWLVARYCHILLLWLTISAHLEGPFFAAQANGIYYYFYQVFRNRAEAIAVARKKKGLGDGNLGMFSWLVVAAVAGCLNVLLTNPIWVLVTRMQTHTQAKKKIMEGKRAAILRDASESSLIDLTTVQDKLAKLESMKPHPYGTLHAVQEVYREAGITGFWKGIIPTLIMVCNPSIQFMIYESSLKHLKAKRAYSKRGLKNVTALEVFLLGALAKLGATVSTYPLLVVKSRLQAKQEIGGSNALRYTGTLDAIIKMIHYEGLPGFYKGMSTKIVQSVFAASVLFMVKEELVKGYLILANESRKFLPNVNK